MKFTLGAYQFAELEKIEDDTYYDSKLVLTSPIDEPFVNRKLTLMLSEEARLNLSAALGEL